MKDAVTSDSSGNPVFREAPQPSRSRPETTRTDDGVKSQTKWSPFGQAEKSQKFDDLGNVTFESTVEHHAADSSNLVARGRPAKVAAGTAIESQVTYAMFGTGETVAIEDPNRGTTTVEYRDARGAVIRRLVSAGGNTLSDEQYGYDASGLWWAKTPIGRVRVVKHANSTDDTMSSRWL